MQENHLYGRITNYLNSLTSIEELDFTNLVTRKKPNEIDDFIGAKVMWQIEGSGAGGSRNLILKVRKADKRRILRPYLQLKFHRRHGDDVYDLDLLRVKDDSELKILLLQTITKSVIVIEDLDQYIAEKPASLSFSGISNFMDVLLNSCCAEERVMVFPMNSKDHVDLAFLRPALKKSGDELSRGEGAQALPSCPSFCISKLGNGLYNCRARGLIVRASKDSTLGGKRKLGFENGSVEAPDRYVWKSKQLCMCFPTEEGHC
ncbi:unnamed protein product [Malus baccata var. baccata]